MEERISAKEIKKIIKEITDSESKRYGIDIKLCPLSFVDIVNSSFVKGTKYTIVRRIGDYVEYFNYNGYNDLKGNAVVFVDKIADTRIYSNLKDLGELYANEIRYDLAQQYNRVLGRNTEYLRKAAERGNGYIDTYDGALARGLFQVLKTSYHEIRHSVQLTFDRYSYEKFLCDIENFFIKCNLGRDYKHNHDSYSFEIGANLYGTRMAKEYLMNKYPLIYEKDKAVIELIEKRYMNDYLLYNPSYTIDRVLPWIKISSVFSNNDKTVNNISPVLSIFLNEDVSFKRPSEVMNDEKYQGLDKRIVYAMFSSLSFLKELKYMNDLSFEEINIVTDAMDYTNNLCMMQMKFYDEVVEHRKATEGYFSRQLLKTTYLMLYANKHKYVKRYLNSFDDKRKFASDRSRGYLSIYLFGLIISIGTIIYLYIKK